MFYFANRNVKIVKKSISEAKKKKWKLERSGKSKENDRIDQHLTPKSRNISQVPKIYRRGIKTKKIPKNNKRLLII